MSERRILDSWKEISDYLNRDVRTCRRYEKDLALPVHRLEGSGKARVFAYTDEVDAWRDKKRLAPDGRSSARGARPWIWWAAGTITVLSFLTAGLLFLAGRKPPAAPLVARLSGAVQVTAALGVEDHPSWSPDGRALAFHSDQAGNWDVWVVALEGGGPVNRTPDSPGADIYPRWSPDGRWISFYSTREGGGYFVMPALGGRPRKVVDQAASTESWVSPASWSPDGRKLAYARGQKTEPWIEVLEWESGRSEKIGLPFRPFNNVVVTVDWSPDGRWLAYERSFSRIAATSELWLTRAADGQSVRLTDGSHKDRSPSWSPDSRALRFVSNRGGAFDLWRLSIGSDGRPEGPARQVSAGLEMTRAAVDAAGRKLAYVKGRDVRNAFRFPVLQDRPATWADVTQLTFDAANVESLDVSPDGRLVASSDRSGNWDIYLLPSGGGDLRPLVTDPAMDAGPRWSSDGREVAFYSSRTGHREVWVLPSGGGTARQLTRGRTESLFPAWSPDGSRIVKAGGGLAIVPVRGGEEILLTDEITDGYPDWSPDGRWVAFSSERGGGRGLWRVAAAGGPAMPLTAAADPADRWTPRWSPDGSQIYFVALSDHPADYIGVLTVETREERVLTALEGRRGMLGHLGLAVDGRFVYFTWEESRADIWVADIVEPPRR